MSDFVPALPAFGRLDDWFGMALIEPVRGGRLFAHYSAMAQNGSLATHIQAVSTARRAMSEQEKKAEAQERRLYPVAQITQAMAADGSESTLGKRTDGEPFRCAIVELSGTLMKSPSSTDDATSTVFARSQLRAAAADDQVDAIVVSIDSPGGYVSGTEDLAAEIRAAAQAKPLVAFVEDLCASAAYWCACGAPKIFANNKTAQIGSIGVVMAFYEAVGMAGQMGLKPVVIATGKYKGMGFPGTEITAEQRAKLQDSVNETMGQFVDVVSKGRGMKADAVRALATGEVYGAAEAATSGLIDGMKSFDQCLAYLGGQVQKQGGARGGGGGKRGGGRASEGTISDLKSEISEGEKADKTIGQTADATNQSTAGVVPVADGSPDAGQVSKKGDAMSDPVKKAASLAELKAKLPKSSAEFRETCMEAGLSLEEAALRYGNEQAEAVEQLKAQKVTIGNQPVAGKPAGAGHVPAANGVSAKRTLLDATSQLMQASGGRMARHEAWKQACKENPEARRELVVAANLKHGRKKQAAAFAEDFDDTAPAGDD